MSNKSILPRFEPKPIVIETTEIADDGKGRPRLRRNVTRVSNYSDPAIRAALLEPPGSNFHLVRHTITLTSPGRKETRTWYEREEFQSS